MAIQRLLHYNNLGCRPTSRTLSMVLTKVCNAGFDAGRLRTHINCSFVTGCLKRGMLVTLPLTDQQRSRNTLSFVCIILDARLSSLEEPICMRIDRPSTYTLKPVAIAWCSPWYSTGRTCEAISVLGADHCFRRGTQGGSQSKVGSSSCGL
jgi:hypothetical protein